MRTRLIPFAIACAVVLVPGALCRAAGASQRAQITRTAVSLSSLPAGRHAMAAVEVEVKPGFHAQSHLPLDPSFVPFELQMRDNPAVRFGEPQYPPGEIHNYPALGNLSVFVGKFLVYVPLEVKPDAPQGPIELGGTLTYQICDDTKCFLPERPSFTIKSEIVPAGTQVTPHEPDLFKGAGAGASRSATQPVASANTPAPPVTIAGRTLAPDAMALAFLFAFVAGIIFNVMPCVLPVLPLKAIGFYEVSQHNRRKSLAFGAVFSLGLIATFAAFGLLIFVFHTFDWGGLFTKGWFIAGIVIILLAMAASTFGLFTVNLPPAVYSVSPRHDTYWGNFLFGILTAVLSTPCTFGMFVAILTWAISQPPVVGVLILVTVGAGMAFPYFLLSALPEVARRFPRTGPWAELVKQMMGFLLLLAAVYFARPFLGRIPGLHAETFWWAPFAVIVAAAVYLLVRTFQLSRRPVPRIVGTACAVLLVAGSLGAVRQLTDKPFEWQPYTDAALEQGRGASHIVLVEFTADWCGNCQWVEAHVLHSRRIVSTVKRRGIVMLKADVTRDDAAGRPLLEKLNPAGSIPLTVIYAPGRDQPIELTGIYSAQDLERAIELAAAPPRTEVARVGRQ